MFNILKCRTANAVLFVLFLTGAAQAETRIVDNTTDTAALIACTTAANDCSLRGAISGAAAGDTIIFDSGVFNVPRTIDLPNGQLTINKNLTISGTGANLLTVRSTAPASTISRVFYLTAGTITLSGMTITGGNVTSGDGGGIYNTAVLTLNNVVIDGNTAARFGGGIENISSSLTITNSTISNNRSAGTSGNGGGIDITSGTMTLSNVTVSGNSTANAAGANSGGGIAAYNASGSVTLINCTITNNSNGGGSTSGAGGYYGVAPTITNTIIAGNAFNTTVYEFRTIGAAPVANNNLIGNIFGALITNGVNGNQVGTIAAPIDPRLISLGNYGGQTLTHGLLNNSTAINAGTATSATTTDQRGVARSGNVDIGAFESNTAAAAPLANGVIGQPYSQTIVPNTIQNGTDFFYCYSGTLPAGLTTNIPVCGVRGTTNDFAPAAMLTVSGTPTTAGTRNLSLLVSGNGGSTTVPLSITVLAPTAAVVSVAGSVFAPGEAGLTGAIVVLTDMNGVSQSIQSGRRGAFAFEEVEAGKTYVISVQSKRFRYAPQIVSATQNLSGLTFAPQ